MILNLFAKISRQPHRCNRQRALTACHYVWIFAVLVAPGVVLSQPGPGRELPPEGATISDEFRVPVTFQAMGGLGNGFNGGIEYNRYYSRRLHNVRHRTLFGEAVALPTSSVHVGLLYQSNPDLSVENTGYSVRLGAVMMLGDMGLGIWARVDRSDLPAGGEPVDDYEFGPQISFWPGDRIYINDRLLYRRIDSYRDPDIGRDYSTEDFVEIRHHLTYIPAEHWDFTYAHDVDIRVGIHQNYHTNNLTVHNYFLYSPTVLFSYGPLAGVSLDYTVGSRTSVLTIPIGLRAEYFFTSLSLLQANVLYDMPTMKDQRAGQVRVQGSFSYRF